MRAKNSPLKISVHLYVNNEFLFHMKNESQFAVSGWIELINAGPEFTTTYSNSFACLVLI